MTRVVVVLCGLCVARPALATEPVVRPAAVDAAAAAALREWAVPGLAVAVVHDGRAVVLKGYGTKRVGTDDPVTPDTQFDLASCGKAFTTTLLAVLADDGRLKWDDPARTHLPAFHLSDPKADALLTVRDLVSHRTGVSGHDLIWYHAPWGIDENIRRATRLPLEGQFRDSYHYNSLMVMAAGRAAAAAGGKPWDVLVRERITGPLGMTGVTFTSAEAAMVKDRATGHRPAAGGAESMAAYPFPEPNPAGSIAATARDMVPWLNLHLANGLHAGKRLVSAENLGETHAPHVSMRRLPDLRATYPESKQVSYGMGWVVYDYRGELVVAHGGMIDGFRVQIVLLPGRNLGFALLNNLHQTLMNVALANVLIDQFLGLPAKDWHAHYHKTEADGAAARRAEADAREKARKPGTKPSLPPDGYAGTYEDAAYGTATVTAAGGRLALAWSNFRSPLEHFEDDVYRIAGGFLGGRLVEFRVAGGKVVGMRVLDVDFTRK